jgi:hypothetical protein
MGIEKGRKTTKRKSLLLSSARKVITEYINDISKLGFTDKFISSFTKNLSDPNQIKKNYEEIKSIINKQKEVFSVLFNLNGYIEKYNRNINVRDKVKRKNFKSKYPDIEKNIKNVELLPDPIEEYNKTLAEEAIFFQEISKFQSEFNKKISESAGLLTRNRGIGSKLQTFNNVIE